MNAPTLTLSDLVFGPVCRDLDPVDRALQIDEHIQCVTEMQARIEELECDLANVTEERDDAQKAYKEAEENSEAAKALGDLVKAIDNAKLGKVARVGGLVIIEEAGDMEQKLGAVLARARKALK